jgi:hypothetical protein
MACILPGQVLAAGTAHRVGDTREGDELMHRFEALEFVKVDRVRGARQTSSGAGSGVWANASV